MSSLAVFSCLQISADNLSTQQNYYSSYDSNPSCQGYYYDNNGWHPNTAASSNNGWYAKGTYGSYDNYNQSGYQGNTNTNQSNRYYDNGQQSNQSSYGQYADRPQNQPGNSQNSNIQNNQRAPGNQVNPNPNQYKEQNLSRKPLETNSKVIGDNDRTDEDFFSNYRYGDKQNIPGPNMYLEGGDPRFDSDFDYDNRGTNRYYDDREESPNLLTIANDVRRNAQGNNPEGIKQNQDIGRPNVEADKNAINNNDQNDDHDDDSDGNDDDEDDGDDNDDEDNAGDDNDDEDDDEDDDYDANDRGTKDCKDQSSNNYRDDLKK